MVVAPPSPAAPTSVLHPSLRGATGGVVVLVTLFAFEALAVATALPTAARELDGLAVYGWAFTAFLVANVIGMVTAGGTSDRVGPRRPMVIGVAGFLAGLAVAGAAPSMVVLVAGRAVQGFSGGMAITALYVVIGRLYPESLQPRIVAAMSAAWVVPSLVGPVVAGTVTEHVGWRWVFLGLLPLVLVGAALLVAPLRRLDMPAHPATPAPLAGRLGRALAVAAAVTAVQQAGQADAVWAVLPAVAGLALLGWALRGLLPAGAFRVGPGVAGPVVVRGLLAGAFFGVESLVPLTLSQQHGFGALAAGVPLTFGAVSWAAGSWVQGRSARGGPADDERRRVRLVRAGCACIAVAAGGIALVAQPATPGWVVFPFWAVAGLGAGLGISGVSVLLLRYTSDAERGNDSSAMQLSDAVGGALATGLGGILVALAVRGTLSRGAAFATTDLAMCAVALLGVAVAGRMRPA